MALMFDGAIVACGFGALLLCCVFSKIAGSLK
jgi:hypothetical protein